MNQQPSESLISVYMNGDMPLLVPCACGRVETDETENGNGKLKLKTETEKLKLGNGRKKWLRSGATFCACANCICPKQVGSGLSLRFYRRISLSAGLETRLYSQILENGPFIILPFSQ